MVLASVGIITVAVPFARQFGTNHSAVTDMALVIMFYALGLVPFSVLFVVQRVFYALEDTRTPFLLQVSQSLVFVALALVVATFSTGTIAFGLALSASIAGLVQTLLALIVMSRKLGGFSFRPLLRSYLSFALAALPASVAGVLLLTAFGGDSPGAIVTSSALAAVGVGALITVAMVVVYFLGLLLLREPEVTAFISNLRTSRASR
jgi:putative peptidoglycan lipid II flippase